jgi:hypothetical protein
VVYRRLDQLEHRAVSIGQELECESLAGPSGTVCGVPAACHPPARLPAAPHACHQRTVRGGPTRRRTDAAGRARRSSGALYCTSSSRCLPGRLRIAKSIAPSRTPVICSSGSPDMLDRTATSNARASRQNHKECSRVDNGGLRPAPKVTGNPSRLSPPRSCRRRGCPAPASTHPAPHPARSAQSVGRRSDR